MHCLAEEYRMRGHDVRLLFREGEGRFSEFTFGMRLALSAAARWADVVDVHAVDAWPLCLLPRRPVVVARSHGLELVVHRGILDGQARGAGRIALQYWFYRGSLRPWFERQAIRRSDATVVLNEGDRQLCLEEFRAEAGRLHRLPNGFPAAFLDAPIGSGTGIVFLGSWLPRKGNDLAAEAIVRILESRPDLPPVLLAGTGGSEESVCASFPAALRHRLRVVPKFQRGELPELLRDAGILLFPSRSEGYPLSLAETMACGIAPVAARIPGVVEMVDDGRTGLLVGAEDGAQGFAKAILSLLDDPHRLAGLRAQARESIRPSSWRSVAGAQLELYETLLDRRGARP